MEYNDKCPKCKSCNIEMDTKIWDGVESFVYDCLDCECGYEIRSNGFYVWYIDEKKVDQNLMIETDVQSLEFLEYLVNIKRFDVESLIRVIKNPKQNNELYKQYKELKK
mgnify:CR=1 FL=1